MAISDSRRLEPLEVSRPLAKALMKLYDYPHPRRPGRTIRGYDRPHAVRTAKMCVTVADRLGHPCDRVRLYHVACLLHDLGRAGLERALSRYKLLDIILKILSKKTTPPTSHQSPPLK